MALNAAPVAAAAARPKPKSMLLLLLLATCAGAVVGLPGCLDWPAPLVSGLFCTLDE